MSLFAQLRPAVTAFVLLTGFTGIVYPALVTGVAAIAFPKQSHGSLVVAQNGAVVGSALLGVCVTEPGLFHGRPSAIGDDGCSTHLSGGSNLGPTTPVLTAQISERIAAQKDGTQTPPTDLVTTSGSGLDPHISPEGAHFQVPRIAAATGMDAAALHALVDQATEGRTFGLLGEPRVNVLALNLALQEKLSKPPR